MNAMYPFTALVGQAQLRLALVLQAVCPHLGGVLLRGEKGTAKSTAARGLAELLPGPGNFRTLPLNTTEDRLAGGIDLDKTIAAGKPVFSPGLLAEVDGGVLYVDEVNLLDDHLVDMVLDASASGINRVEREGLSLSHPSRFALIGTMNPEEGSLRPQLLDRFGMCVEVSAETDPDMRVELMRRRLAYDADPAGFASSWHEEQMRLAAHIQQATALLPEVCLRPDVRQDLLEIVAAANPAGHRADIACELAARAHAALAGRLEVSLADVLAVAELVLAHRRRQALPPPPPAPPSQHEQNQQGSESEQSEVPDKPNEPETSESAEQQQASAPAPPRQEAAPPQGQEHADAQEHVSAIGAPFGVKNLAPSQDRFARRGSGRRLKTRSTTKLGRYVRSRPATTVEDLALDATLRAAAVHQKRRHRPPGRGVVVHPMDWQTKVRERHTGTCVIFLVDASGSMGTRGRMIASKGAVLSLLLDAYQKRDKVALIAFRRASAQVLVAPTPSVDVANRVLRELPIGGRTPLAAGLLAASNMLRPLLRKDKNLRPLVVLVSDGRANVRVDGTPGNGVADALAVADKLGEDDRIMWVVVDTEERRGVRLGLAGRLAAALQAHCYAIDDLRATDLVSIVKGHT